MKGGLRVRVGQVNKKGRRQAPFRVWSYVS